MKEIAALALLIVLVVVGWNQSYKNHFDGLMGNPPPTTPAPAAVASAVAAAPSAVAPAVPAATPMQDQTWMWEKKPGAAPLPTPGKLGGKHGH